MLRLALALSLLAAPALAEGPDWVPPPPPGVQAIQNSPTHAKEVPATAAPQAASPQSVPSAQEIKETQELVAKAALRAAVEREQLMDQIQLQTQQLQLLNKQLKDKEAMPAGPAK
jgi:hypothetical protein